MKKIINLILSLGLISIPSACFAQIEELFKRAGNILNFLFSWVLVIATIAVIIAGYQYMTSGGSPEQMQKAKTNLTWIIVGLAAVILAKAIVIFILSSLGGNPSLFGL